MVRIGWEPALDLGRKAEPALGATQPTGELAFLAPLPTDAPTLLRNPLFCVSTVSIVCPIKASVPVRAEDGLDPLHVHCRWRG
jgi:hypothetical protein